MAAATSTATIRHKSPTACRSSAATSRCRAKAIRFSFGASSFWTSKAAGTPVAETACMMKPMRCQKLMTAAVALSLFPRAVMADAARYELDSAHTTIAFMVEHVGYAKTLGQFLRASGGYTFDDETGTLSSLRVVVATDSVDTHHEARDEHLRSGEFLDVEEHPEMTFT